jgi:hypothetical protein
MKISVPVFPMTAARYFHTRSGARTLGGVSRGTWEMGRYDLRRYHGPTVSTVTRRSCGNAAPRSNALLRT